MDRVSLASRDDDDIDPELGNRVGEAIQYVKELRRKMMELDRKKEQLEDVQRRLNEISKECNQSDDSWKKDKDGLWKRLEELQAEFYEIIDSSTGLDLGVGSGSSGEAGPTQDVGASMSKSGGQDQEGRNNDDVKRGRTAGKQSCEIRSAHVEGKGEDAFDEGDLFEVPDYTLAESVSTNFEGLELREPIKNTIKLEKLEGDEKKGKDVFDLGSDCTETEEESQELEKECDVKKRFLDKIAKSDSSNDLEHPLATDTEEISTNIVGLDQELKNIVQEQEKDPAMKKTKSDSSNDLEQLVSTDTERGEQEKESVSDEDWEQSTKWCVGA